MLAVPKIQRGQALGIQRETEGCGEWTVGTKVWEKGGMCGKAEWGPALIKLDQEELIC